MKKIFFTFLLVLALFVYSCSSGEKEISSNLPTMSVSTHPYIHGLPIIYAQEYGLLDGYDNTLTTYSGGPTQNEAISSDAWEVGTTGVGGAVLGIVGYGLKVIGYGGTDSETLDIWVRPDSPLLNASQDEKGIYGNAEDWKGLDILCASGTTVQMTLFATLDKIGLNDGDVNIVDISVPQSFAAFKAGEGDVVVLWSPFGIYAEREGWVKISSAKQLGLDIPIFIVATEKAVTERPEMVQDWLDIYLESSEILANDYELASKMLYGFQKNEGIRVDEDSAYNDVEDRGFPTIALNKEYFKKDSNGNRKISEAVLQYTDFLISEGILTEADKKEMLDNNFVDTRFVENLPN